MEESENLAVQSDINNKIDKSRFNFKREENG